jgi:homoserine kinase
LVFGQLLVSGAPAYTNCFALKTPQNKMKMKSSKGTFLYLVEKLKNLAVILLSFDISPLCSRQILPSSLPKKDYTKLMLNLQKLNALVAAAAAFWQTGKTFIKGSHWRAAKWIFQ